MSLIHHIHLQMRRSKAIWQTTILLYLPTSICLATDERVLSEDRQKIRTEYPETWSRSGWSMSLMASCPNQALIGSFRDMKASTA